MPDDDTKEDWTVWGFRTMFGILMGIVAFYLSQINTSIGDLNIALKAIEVHLNESDKRILAIEVAREINAAGYKKLLDQFEEMKIKVTENALRILEIQRRK